MKGAEVSQATFAQQEPGVKVILQACTCPKRTWFMGKCRVTAARPGIRKIEEGFRLTRPIQHI